MIDLAYRERIFTDCGHFDAILTVTIRHSDLMRFHRLYQCSIAIGIQLATWSSSLAWILAHHHPRHLRLSRFIGSLRRWSV